VGHSSEWKSMCNGCEEGEYSDKCNDCGGFNFLQCPNPECFRDCAVEVTKENITILLGSAIVPEHTRARAEELLAQQSASEIVE